MRKAGGRKAHSRQLLQGALLVDLVGAVGNVRVEVLLCVVLQDVTDVLHTHLCLVPLLQGFKEPAALKWGVVGEVKAQFWWVCAHTYIDTWMQTKVSTQNSLGGSTWQVPSGSGRMLCNLDHICPTPSGDPPPMTDQLSTLPL